MKQWIDATDFTDLGEWKLDTQFVHLMGSPYLLACQTPGKPVADASTRFVWKGSGKVRAWVRTKNWLFPHAPGRFQIALDGVSCTPLLGGMPSHDWYWELAGDFDLTPGEHTLTLLDRTGYFGRCAAVFLTDDMDTVPPRPTGEYIAMRAEEMGVSLSPVAGGEYDVVVAGGGPGGVPAAIAAARTGARTLLISGRPVLGGNGSGEAGVGFHGASSRQCNAREGGIAEEIVRTHFAKSQNWEDVLSDLTKKEPLLTVIYGYIVTGVEKDGERIRSVTATSILDNSAVSYTGKQFLDCTGDAWLGYYAGAKYRIGREAAWQYGEEFAPETADTMTMSGCTMVGYHRPWIRPMYAELDHEVSYEAPDWVPRFPKGKEYGRNIERIGFMWWLEAPNTYDDLYDTELARDELFRIHLGHYHYLKNLWDERDRAKNTVLQYMPYYDAKRESRRLIGDYVLTQNDCTEGRDFEDTVSHTGWPIDLHNPKGIYSGTEGPFFSNTHIPMAKVPYRCLYSVNVPNLSFAGRCLSVTHVALGTARVQNTIAAQGQAAGTAAALCVRHGCDPRTLGREHLSELRQTLLRDDQYIPGLRADDPDDLARGASVSATSVSHSETWLPYIGLETEGYEMTSQLATFFARGVSDEVHSVWTKLTNKNDKPASLAFHVRLQADPDGYTAEEDLLVCRLTLPASSTGWYEIPIHTVTKLRYLWMWSEVCPGVFWHTWRAPALDHTHSQRTNPAEPFVNVRGETHCVLLEKPNPTPADCSPENVINGYSRALDAAHYEWVSDPAASLPQALTLTLPRVSPLSRIHLTFDSDMTNPATLRPFEPFPHTLVTAYAVEVRTDGEWKTVARESENFLRRRVHTFPAVPAEAVRITVLDSGDHRVARIFEVRLYSEA